MQTLFLDFDGARVNTGIFFGPGVRTLSPLRSFLGPWGLRNADLNPLIDRIIATVRENVEQDMLDSGLNANFRVRILNSRDHADPFGKPNVSRVIVGGTIAESGIPTIGIAQTIDPGNFGTEETALVLLDILSNPPTEPDGPELSNYITPASDRLGFIGRAVGNVVAHEAGHFFGDWHVDQFNDVANLMDQGGNFPVMFGVGPDGIGGTADDVDVDFGEDAFNPNEGFLGTEDTLSRIAFVLHALISPGAAGAPPTRCAGGLLAAYPIRHVDRLTGLEPVDDAGVDVGLASHGRRVAELVRHVLHRPPDGSLARWPKTAGRPRPPAPARPTPCRATYGSPWPRPRSRSRP